MTHGDIPPVRPRLLIVIFIAPLLALPRVGKWLVSRSLSSGWIENRIRNGNPERHQEVDTAAAMYTWAGRSGTRWMLHS
jgi:hypothetical protein